MLEKTEMNCLLTNQITTANGTISTINGNLGCLIELIHQRSLKYELIHAFSMSLFNTFATALVQLQLNIKHVYMYIPTIHTINGSCIVN